MPRPGPRPYECVRKAWHSDRHQPIRGSLIQEMFRVAHEIHSPATRKNKEWQEKLPVVVLKAEEIMYSKANSEAEYSDFKTIWERANDAIDTIIRRDESNESGDRELLQPCIEAALNLGCAATRTSRSQRHHPRSYLSSERQEAGETSTSLKISDKMICPRSCVISSPLIYSVSSSNHQTAPNYLHPPMSMALTSYLGSDNCRAAPSQSMLHGKLNLHPLPYSEFPHHFHNIATLSCHEHPALHMANYRLPAMDSTYSLHHCSGHQMFEPNHTFQHHPNSGTGTFIAGQPLLQQPAVDAKTGFLANVIGFSNVLADSNETAKWPSKLCGASKDLPGRLCDLSLQLGPPSSSCLRFESSAARGVVVSSSSCDGQRSCDLTSHRVVDGNHSECMYSYQRDQEFNFFVNHDSGNFSNPPLSRLSSAAALNIDSTIRKRKAPIGGSFEDEQFLYSNCLKRQLFDRKEWRS